jgi:hypothetical protein
MALARADRLWYLPWESSKTLVLIIISLKIMPIDHIIVYYVPFVKNIRGSFEVV